MLELYASLGRVDMGPRQCVFVVILVSSSTCRAVQLTRPIFDTRVARVNDHVAGHASCAASLCVTCRTEHKSVLRIGSTLYPYQVISYGLMSSGRRVIHRHSSSCTQAVQDQVIITTDRKQFGCSVYIRLHRDERGKKHVMGSKTILYTLECAFMRKLSGGACCDVPHDQQCRKEICHKHHQLTRPPL
jgi:hypothetical protein